MMGAKTWLKTGLKTGLAKRDGQSLIEVLIGLTIGAILIGAASLGVVFILRSSTATQYMQSGTQLNQDLVDRVRSVSAATWQDLYSLTKGTSTSYFVSASGTELIAIEGKEGVLSNEIFDGLVAHWKVDEATGTTVYDVSGKGNHGSFIGEPVKATSSCKASYCLSFDAADDRVSVPATLNSLPTSAITVSAWVNVPNHVNWYDYVRNNWAGIAGAWLLYSDSSGNARFGVIDNSLAQKGALGCATAFTTSTWHMLAGTYDGTVISSYLDGIQCNSTSSLSGQTLYTSGAVQFGEWGSAGANTHYIDDVRIYNRALSADEIQRLWNSTVFTRYFTIENVERDSGGSIVTSGGNDDPSTQKITSYVDWPGAAGATGRVTVVDYVTRWMNRVFSQSDWSGGSGDTGVLTEPSNRYSNATSISSPAGSIKIEGL
jgi:hypothetical protein